MSLNLKQINENYEKIIDIASNNLSKSKELIKLSSNLKDDIEKFQLNLFNVTRNVVYTDKKSPQFLLDKMHSKKDFAKNVECMKKNAYTIYSVFKNELTIGGDISRDFYELRFIPLFNHVEMSNIYSLIKGIVSEYKSGYLSSYYIDMYKLLEGIHNSFSEELRRKLIGELKINGADDSSIEFILEYLRLLCKIFELLNKYTYDFTKDFIAN
ncbi:hypothetical protein [Fluviispira vulneris]|uniref:hypothetical protein n=1 Tax=Fluviispira vulneris TaxID=2763012 RepID=UPI001645D054|nr:hypothetical protein [Fluviispira vulneris]